MKRLIYFLTGIIGTGILAVGGTYLVSSQFGAVTPVIEYEQLGWIRPITYEEWDKDVKAEQLDLRSDAVLDEMLIRHTEKQIRVWESYREWEECPDCIKYDIRKGLQAQEENKDLNKIQIDALVNENFNNDFVSAKEDYERLKRSIERMTKEKEMRGNNKVKRIKTID